MTQAEFERQVAQTTGESCATIRRRGFSLLVMPEREPLAIDWDEPPHAEPPRPFRWRRQRVVAWLVVSFRAGLLVLSQNWQSRRSPGSLPTARCVG